MNEVDKIGSTVFSVKYPDFWVCGGVHPHTPKNPVSLHRILGRAKKLNKARRFSCK